jgi:O-antigen/teichoic acid export membrane protein
MSTGLDLEPPSPAAEELLIASAGSPSPHATVPLLRKTSPFGTLLSYDSSVFQGVVSLADQAVASGTNFVTGVILARACSREELGLYALGFSLILLMTDFQTSLITTPYMVYAPRLKGDAHASYTGSTLIHQLTFCLLVMLGVAGGAIVVTHGIGPRGLGPVLWALAPVIALIMLREHARRVSFARLRLMTAFLFDTCIAIGQISGLALLAHFRLLSASRAFWIIGSVCAIAVLGWLWSDRHCYSPRLSESLADLKKNWTFGKWVFASGLVVAVSMNLYPWFLAAFQGTASTAVWAACLGVASVGNPALLGIQNLLGPKIAHVYAVAGPEALRRLVFKASLLIALLMSLLCVAMFYLGGWLVVLLYGPQYTGHGLIVTIMAINFLVLTTAFPFTRALYAVERADLDFLGNLIAVVIMVTIGLWFVRVWGPLGAALALLGSSLVTSAAKVGAFLMLPPRTS